MQILLFLFTSFFIEAHELHLSMCAIDYNEQAHRIEIQQRIFYDDLEKSIQIQLEDERFNILAPEQSEMSYDSLFEAYFNRHFDLYINDEKVKVSLLEYEIHDDAIVLYLYKSEVKKLNSIDLYSHILFELFNDQDNVISVQAYGKKKSQKFSINSKPLEINY